jgi:amino acid transporter
MSIQDAILGKPLPTSEDATQRLGVVAAIGVLGIDALASTGYGPEAALSALTPAGLHGLLFFPAIVAAVLAQMTMLYLTYQQVAEAYPDGGGAYTVASRNLGRQPALWAAIALLIDYLLNVAVGIAAGVGAVVSAAPALQPFTLDICLAVLLTLTLVNLRGVRESGMVFVVPVFVFVGCIGAAIAVGLGRAAAAAGLPHPAVAPPPLPSGSGTLGAWLLLVAFASGCTAMTGIEAVSNGVPLFREPKTPHARRTLIAIFVILLIFLSALAFLCPAYRIGAMNEGQAGYQTVLSQLIAAIAGRGAFYYIASASIFIVLTYSAQTSFADFPRVCRLPAEDRFLPPFFATRGRRLVFSTGILMLAALSALLLIAFGGMTQKLMPLFAVGAFAGFLLSQAGMAVHWKRSPGPGARRRLLFNALGAATTALALAVIILARFREGAWVAVVVWPLLAIALNRLSAHYEKTERQVEPLGFHPSKPRPPVVIIPVDTWNRATEKALRFGLLFSDEITAIHVRTEMDDGEELRRLWREQVEVPAEMAGSAVPKLEIVESPYRFVYQPILDFVTGIRRYEPSRLIAVIIPELVRPHWYQYLLHNLHGRRLRSRLNQMRDGRTIVIPTPYYLPET